ncbi:MAG: putative metal-binding motif-containing protein, partial [Planctomycetota bacterium]
LQEAFNIERDIFGTPIGDPDWDYWFFNGTSMAAPHVAAVAAMLYSKDLSITPDGVKIALTSTALDLNESGYDSTSGWGLVQAADALNYSDSGCTNSTFYLDSDGDGFGNPDVSQVFCVPPLPSGYVADSTDCDDSDADVHPGHNDTKGRWGHNNVDNDCDGLIDQ